jgi:hypothetical protein
MHNAYAKETSRDWFVKIQGENRVIWCNDLKHCPAERAEIA